MGAIQLQAFTKFDERNVPPAFEYEPGKGYIEPSSDHVISMRDDKVLSLYKDDTWDLTPYSGIGTGLIYFTIGNEALKQEVKRLLFLYMTHGGGRGGNLPGGGTIENIYRNCVKGLAEHALGLGCSINEILSNAEATRTFIMGHTKGALHRAKTIRTILNLLKSMSIDRSGFDYVHSKNNRKILEMLHQKFEDTREQTLLIPIEIFNVAAKQRWEHICFIEKHIENLAAFISDNLENRGFGGSSKNTRFRYSKDKQTSLVPWDKAVRQHRLEELFEKYNVTGLKNMQTFVNELQGTCRHLIHQYTGMRDNECRALSIGCWRDKNAEMPSRIFGRETKIHGVPTRHVWITHDVIERIIKLLTTLYAPVIKKVCPTLKDPPLMFRNKVVFERVKENHFDALKPSAMDTRMELPYDEKPRMLTQEHIDEMSLVDDRDWSNHEWVKVGGIWRFTSHQYRRSLAVYALGSGLVSLFAIKEQFGHLLSLMTAYYANGHRSARKLDGSIDDKDHIARYMQGISNDMKFYSYRKNVLLSKSPLFGANGIHLEKHIVARTPEEREVVMHSSEKYKVKFRKGLLDYQETAMGGCTNTACEKFLLPDFFISCKVCESAIHRLEKVERLAENAHRVAMKWAEIQPDGIDHRTATKLAIEIDAFVDVLRNKQEKREIV